MAGAGGFLRVFTFSGMHAAWKRIRGGNALGLALKTGLKPGVAFAGRYTVQFFENIEKFHFRTSGIESVI